MPRRSRHRLRELYRATLRMPPSARRRFLDEECGEDTEMRDQILSMLRDLDDVQDPAPIGILDTNPTEDALDRVLPYPEIGPYELIRVIARGAMGTVYEAREKGNGRRVAVKCVHGGASAAAPDVLRRFELESQTLAHLKHPHIASIYSSGRSPDGAPYIAMEFIPGESLAEYVRFRKLDLRNLLQLFQQLCDAVFHAHVNGVIHRDLKPSNILVTEDSTDTESRASVRSNPVVKVLDFGLARVTNPEIRLESAISESRAFLGTIQYMSPEQAAGDSRNTDARSDVYSLGVLLYELLTEHQPYDLEGALLPEVMSVICHQPARRPSQWNDDLRGDLETILLTTLEKDPRRRYQSADAISSDIGRYLDGLPILARATSPAGYLFQVAERHRAVTITLCVAILALISVTLWFLMQLKDERNAAQAALTRAVASEKKATERAVEAETQREIANERHDRVEQLEDARHAGLLIRRSLELWPAVPAMAPAMDEWITEAEALLTRREKHRSALRELALVGEPAPHEEDETLRFHTERAAALEEMIAESPEPELRNILTGDLDDARQTAAAIADRIERQRTYNFEDREDSFRYNSMASLVAELDRLAAPDLHGPTLGAMADRSRRAKTLAERSIDDHLDAWRMAIEEIRDPSRSPAYQGMEIMPQLGLVPLGRDPASGLYEFWHVESGARPTRLANGELSVSADSGVVLVLIPGGAFRPGLTANPGDSGDATSGQARSRVARVEAFFLSKYEITQSQWLDATGLSPSFQRPGSARRPETDLLHPAERISWQDAYRVLLQKDLMLPSELQWEYACRAGTRSDWSSGELENLASAARLTYGEPQEVIGHLPVGSLAANPFGLFDMHGNVAEWCFDRFTDRVLRQVTRERDTLSPLKLPFAHADPRRVYRGGGFPDRPEAARSVARHAALAEARLDSLGVRAARRLDN